MTWLWRRVISCRICLTYLLEKHVSFSLSLSLSLSLSFSVFSLSVSVFVSVSLALSLSHTHTHTHNHTTQDTYPPSFTHTHPHHPGGMHWFPRTGDTCTYLEVCFSPHSQASVLPGTWNQLALQTEDSEDIPPPAFTSRVFPQQGTY